MTREPRRTMRSDDGARLHVDVWTIGNRELRVTRERGGWIAYDARVIDVTEHYTRRSLRTIAVCRSRSRAIDVGMRVLRRST